MISRSGVYYIGTSLSVAFVHYYMGINTLHCRSLYNLGRQVVVGKPINNAQSTRSNFDLDYNVCIHISIK